MKEYIIGIDTGGTYTDAVLLEKETSAVVTTAKKPTTHQQLALGTADALREILEKSGVKPEQISSLVVSSTLATNSVVENKGARVALLVIGYVRHFKLPVKAVIYIKGGHDIIGKEEQPLDIEYLVEIVSNLKDEVDAYGVCSAMSIKNPAHELVAEKAISMLDPKPVFCSHKSSDNAGMKERAATAGLHAKLMPIMNEYVAEVASSMDHLGLTCPMLIVSGNGTTTDADKAVSYAGETVASGPACTAEFGSMHTTEDALVVDVGGTTTDIAMLVGGRPTLAKEGCQIGSWQTHVEAVDMVTGGIGGDSLTKINEKGEVILGPGRVIPLALGSDIPDPSGWLGAGDLAKIITLASEEVPADEIAELIASHKGLTEAQIRKETGISGIPLEKKLEELARTKTIEEHGFTPTDALHVLGKIDLGNRDKSVEAAAILGRELNLDAKAFSQTVLLKTREQIETLLLDYVINHYWGNSLGGFLSQRNAHPVLGVNFALKIPIIGIGAAAPYLLPGVAEQLGTTVSFPRYGDVGNAVGAAMLATEKTR